MDPLAQDLVFARVVSKLREHLERRDLGVDHVVVFVDELNKYAPGRRPRHLRAEDAARPLRARPLPRAGAVLRAAVPLAGASAGGRQRGNHHLRPDGSGRAGHRRVRHALAGHQDQARHPAQGRADGAASALHPAGVRPLSAALRPRRARGRRALPARGRPPLRRGGRPASSARSTRHRRPTGSARSWTGGGRTTCAGRSARTRQRASRRRPGLLHGGAGPAGRAGARQPEDRGDPARGAPRSAIPS